MDDPDHIDIAGLKTHRQSAVEDNTLDRMLQRVEAIRAERFEVSPNGRFRPSGIFPCASAGVSASSAPPPAPSYTEYL